MRCSAAAGSTRTGSARWYFPSAAAYREKLHAAGFTVEDIRVVPRPTALPTSIEPWLDTFGEAFLGALPEPDRSAARAEAADLLRPVLVDETGTWIADYVRLRFRATLPPCEASFIARR